MKVLRDSDGNFVIYLLHLKDASQYEEKPEIIKLVKNTVLKVNKIYHLNLKGFYKVRVYLNKKVGLVIEIIRVDDIDINNAIDLRVLVYFDQEFFIEVDNFDFVPKHKRVTFLDNKYYISVESLSDAEVFSLLELGIVIYKSDLIDSFYMGRVIAS